MSIDAAYNRSYVLGGLNFVISGTISSDLAPPFSVTLAAAKTGTLTTRTDSDTGILTMSSGHGITTAARLDIYWTNTDGSMGRRYGVTVGTVSTNSVPFDLGGGDNLPLVNTEITAQVPNEEVFAVEGDDAVAVACACVNGGTVVFAESDNSTVFAATLTPTGTSYVWTSSDGGTNPLAGGTVAKVFLSQPSSTASGLMYGAVQSN